MTRAALVVLLLLVVAAAGAGSSAAGTPSASFLPFVIGGRPPGDCDLAYPTICLPSPPPDLDCPQIHHQDFPVLPPDPHGLDADEDGIGCESSVAAPALHSVYIHIHASDHLRAQRPNFHQFVFVPDFDHLNRRPSTARLLPAFQLALKSS